jgi:hypothetical protein
MIDLSRIRFALFVLLLMPAFIYARPAVDYLPTDAKLNPDVTTPEAFFGYEVGEWHLDPGRINQYLRHLAEQSPRFAVSEYARSHEQRPLLLTHVSSPEQLVNIEQIRERRQALPETRDAMQQPLVLWMGYSVHGNEPSGANASVLLAYYLAASQDPWIEELLSESVVLIDATLNPDGLSRFAQWVNSQRGTRALNSDPNDIEYNEPWPYSRTNHFWFDLNRDWLLLVHPESQGRIAQFHNWYPHVLTDFHEMGSNSTYFFQPGVPERTHPLTPEMNQTLTAEIARYHADELDRSGTLYWSKEVFDDFYYGKGSTYPDIQGSVGILFEQASSRGHNRDTDNGRLTFAETVSNQLRLSLSTLRGSWANREQLKRYQQDSLDSAIDEGKDADAAGYVVAFGEDHSRGAELIERLQQHQIKVYSLASSVDADGTEFTPGQAFVVPSEQPQYRLVRAIFERRTAFDDETFYDVSAFNLADAFGLPMAALPSRGFDRLLGADFTLEQLVRDAFSPSDKAVAYLLDGRDYAIHEALQRILEADLLPRLATQDVRYQGESATVSLPAGSIVLPVNDRNPRQQVHAVLSAISQQDRRPAIHAINSGLALSGVDLGSPTIMPLSEVRPLILTGPGISMYEVGEIWHLLDTRVGLPLTRVDWRRLDGIDLDSYSHILLANGDYSALGQPNIDRLKLWVSAGGHLIAQRNAAVWAQSLVDEGRLVSSDTESSNEVFADRPYAAYSNDIAKHILGGSILETQVDLSHPAAFGLSSQELALLRAGSQRLKESRNPYETPLRYSDAPLRAGYASEFRRQTLAGDPALQVLRHGAGSLSLLADNPNFRGIWYGGNRVYLNLLYYTPAVRNTLLPGDYPDPSS